MTFKVGLTGGIGSGKTTVANIFKIIGIPVFNADTEAKNLIKTEYSLRNQIISLFGEKHLLEINIIQNTYLKLYFLTKHYWKN